MIGDFLYSLTSRDSVVDPLNVLNDIAIESAVGSTAQRIGYEVPKDRFLLLLRWSSRYEVAFNVRVQPSVLLSDRFPHAPGSYSHLSQSGMGPAGETVVLEGSGPVIVPPGYFVIFEGVWTVPTDENRLFTSLHGILLPRGNLSLAGRLQKRFYQR